MKKVFGLFLSLIVLMGLWSCEQELPEDSKKPNPEESMCLTFVSSGESSVTLVKVGKPFDISLEYSLDGTNWNPYTIGETIYLLEDKLSFRAGEQGNRRFSKGVDDYYQFVFSGEIAARGSIMSLLDRSDLKNVMPSYAFFNLFRDCTGLTKAPELPVTNLAERCYWGMFSGCTSLNEAPDLPATNLAKECYYGMFDGCTGLKKAPELPATELAEHCYSGMFNGCTSLTKAPELPATELAGGCYSNMFNSCTSLTKTPELPAMKLAEECYYYMFWGCTDLTEAPVLPATELAGLCYYGMFGGCTSLTKAPELPAMKLVDNCYCEMFYRCENLSYIKALFTDKPSKETTRNWVYGVATTGTFVKSKDAMWNVRGDNGIPKGWTVEGGAFSAILAVIGTNDNAIIVSDACETVMLTVKSNVSWTASYDTDWIKIDPASIENTDGEVVSTKVSVVFEKNTYKERSAEIKFVAEGVEPVIITAKQHAEESILCVWDMDKFAPSEDPSISTFFLGGQHSFTIHANVDWTATCPSWITIDPTSNKYDGQTQNITVKAVISKNDEADARAGEIKFVGEGVADLVIPVKQAKAARVKATLKETEHPYTDVDFEVVPDEGITWIAMNFDDEEIANLSKNELTPGDFLIYQLNYLLQKGYTADQVTAGLLTSGNGTENVEGLKAETHYQFTAIGAVYDKDYKQFIPTTLPADLEYTTAKAPVAEAAYEALAGTYEMKVVDSKSNERTLQMVVAPLYVNEAYTFYFPNNDFSPVDGTFVDKFVMVYDGANKTITLTNRQVGSEGFTWGFRDAAGNAIDGGMLFYVEVGETSREDGTEAVVPENLIYNWSEDHNALNLTTDLGGKTLHWSALVAKLNSEDKLEILGTFSRFTFTGSTSLVKTAAAASTKSVRSSNSFEDVKSLLQAGPLKYIR